MFFFFLYVGVVGGVLAMGGQGTGGGGGPPPQRTETPVTGVFRDAANDGVRSDGLVAPYDAVIYENGNLMLDVRNVPRQFCMDFPDQTGESVCDDGYFTTGPSPLLDLVGTETSWAKGVVYWSVPGPSPNKTYGRWLRFGTDCDRNDVADNNLTVTRTSTGELTLEGYDAVLCARSTGKGKSTIEFVGEFSMPFHLTLTKVTQ